MKLETVGKEGAKLDGLQIVLCQFYKSCEEEPWRTAENEYYKKGHDEYGNMPRSRVKNGDMSQIQCLGNA